MAEFAVAAAALSLLTLGTIAIGGYQEVDRRAVMAARQSAFLGAWQAGRVGTEDTTRLHEALFADPGVRDTTGSRLLVERDGLAVEATDTVPDGIAGGMQRGLLALLQVSGGFFGSGFDLSQRSLRRGTVEVQVPSLARMPEPFRSLDLRWQVPFALQTDAWHAGSAQHVRRRAGALVPGQRLGELRAIWQPLLAPLILVEPSIARLCLGIIEPDRVPEDRLGPGSSPLPGRCP